MDVLDGLEEVKICIAYEYEEKSLQEFPSSIKVLENCKPIYESLPGWNGSAGKKRYEDLPLNAKKYIEFIEDKLNTPVKIISTGAGREETILL